eukprot:15457049-Alexandrium_andersonii.AAC.1
MPACLPACLPACRLFRHTRLLELAQGSTDRGAMPMPGAMRDCGASGVRTDDAAVFEPLTTL